MLDSFLRVTCLSRLLYILQMGGNHQRKEMLWESGKSVARKRQNLLGSPIDNNWLPLDRRVYILYRQTVQLTMHAPLRNLFIFQWQRGEIQEFNVSQWARDHEEPRDKVTRVLSDHKPFSTITLYKKIFKRVETTGIAKYHEDYMNWHLKDVAAFELLHWQRFHFQLAHGEKKRKGLKNSQISLRSFSTQTTHESGCHGTARSNWMHANMSYSIIQSYMNGKESCSFFQWHALTVQFRSLAQYIVSLIDFSYNFS